MSTSVDLVYEQVRQMAANFEFKPAERINESALSKRLGASRTPLREAMNRLTAEGLLSFEPGRGFFCQPLTPQLVVHLYELREALETTAIRAAVERAADDEIAAIGHFLNETADRYGDDTPTKEIVHLDEAFHVRIAELSGNPELVNMLRLTNERIRYVRWIAMRERVGITHAAHLHIFEALAARDAQSAEDRLRSHIRTRNAEATEIVSQAYSTLYVPQN